MRARTPRVPVFGSGGGLGVPPTGFASQNLARPRTADPNVSSMRPPLPPAALRAAYRQLLRACDFGRRPEVFAYHHVAAVSPKTHCHHQHHDASTNANRNGGASNAFTAAKLGSMENIAATMTPRAVVRAVAATMRNPTIATGASGERNTGTDGAVRMFTELRCAARRAAARAPQPATSLMNLPCLEHPSALLPGESVRLRLREPQHVRLARIALGLDDGDAAADGRFVHLCEDPDDVGAAAAAEAGRPSNAVAGALVTVVEHAWQRDGTLVADCVVGPRVAVLREADDDYAAACRLSSGVGVPPLRRADVRAVHDEDTSPEEPHVMAQLVALVRAQIAAMATVTPDTFAGRTAPPLFDAEALSFYALDVAFPRGNCEASGAHEAERQRWLASRDTHERLRAALAALRA